LRHLDLFEYSYNACMRFLPSTLSVVVLAAVASPLIAQTTGTRTPLPNAKLLASVPGAPRKINNFPTASAISPDKHFAVFLHSGYGAYSSGEKQSLTVLNLDTNELRDFPDDRLGSDSKQSYFLGLAFSLDGQHLYAPMASLTDPLGKEQGSTGNGIAVYRFENGQVTPERFLKIPPRARIPGGKVRRELMKEVTYPAGLSVAKSGGFERILVACNHSDEAILLNAADGQIIERFDLSTFKRIPGSLPYTTVMTSDGTRGYVSLWNASTVAELDLVKRRVTRMLALRKPAGHLEGGAHPSALLLTRDNSRLFVALTNRDEIDILDTKSGQPLGTLSSKLRSQKYGGSDPESLALAPDEQTLYSANALSDSVAVFDLSRVLRAKSIEASGFIPTEWYPTVVVATSKDLLIGSAKGRGSGPNPVALKPHANGEPEYPYNPAMTNGSLARIPIDQIESNLAVWTAQVSASNAAQGNADRVPFASGENKIHHVIYIIKENRTYDQVFGDLAEANGDRSIVLYGQDITPNEHKLARQFGILDNFYDSGDVSGDGHVWSTSASISDYVEKTWPITYHNKEHTYDSEGQLLGGISAEDDLPDAGEPTGGYLWKDFASHGISYRHYGEFIVSKWCNGNVGDMPPTGPPKSAGAACTRAVIKKGQPLEKNVGDPRGGPSPYPWDIPVLAENIAAQNELRDHFDPRFPDFEVAYPDQLRADEFLNEFNAFVSSRKAGKDRMPQFILLRLPNDHTAGGTRGQPRPAASVADNDLAVGRVAEAVSHSPYWDDTAILILEDDAQDGPDHVDSHRSIALVISKYSPLPQPQSGGSGAFVDHTFYTTVNMVRTIEALLGAPPMNANDARAAVMAALFAGPGTQPSYAADYRNRDNGLLYEVNTKEWKEGKNLDFSHADAADHAVLNQFLWQDRRGDTPMPGTQHNVFAVSKAVSPTRRSAGMD
jgi:DNA-binding beta-propeller fold protein YncE